MEHKERLKLLRQWEKTVQDVDVAWKSIQLLFAASPESPVNAAMYDTLMRYTDALSIVVGDKNDWLDWYRFECDMGRKIMKVKAVSWKKPRVIGNVEMLCKCIEAD